MEGVFMGEPLNQNNTVDGGILSRDVKSGGSDVPFLKDSDSLKELEQAVVDGDGGVSPTSSYGSLSICGRRRVMEDTITISPRFKLSNQHTSKLMVFDFFAVYDGHGGASAADVCRNKLHFLVFNEIKESLKEGNEIEWKKVFGDSFAKMDEEADEDMRSIGCTALVALVSLDQIIVANCGASRAVLCRQGQVVPLSLDHQPERPEEQERDWNGSIGDQYSTPLVISIPEVSVTTRNENDEFIILASDGFWDVITTEMACYVVSKCLYGGLGRRLSSTGKGIAATKAATLLAELAVAQESNDNISVLVIELNKV